MRKLYRYISLAAAKLVGRRHVRDIKLPGLRELKNAFVSRSDSAITVRPDFDPISEDVLAVSDGFVTTTPDDYLNSVSGIYGASDLLWFSKMAPVAVADTGTNVACSQYTTGTVTAASGQKTITGTGTAWRENIWVGCWIEMGGDGKYYKIDSIANDTEITVTENLTDSYSADSYAVYKTHQPDHADYKLNLQPFTSGMIYSCPTITTPVDANKICGPFYASIVETSTTQGWVVLETDEDAVNSSGGSSYPNTMATSGTAWMITASSDGSNQDTVIVSSGDPGNAANWSDKSIPAGFDMQEFDTPTIYHNGKFYIGGRDTNSSNRMAVIYTADGGDNWTMETHPSVVGYVAALIGDNSSTIVAANSVADNDIYYTTNDFSTWNTTACPTGSLTGYSAAYGNGYHVIFTGGVFWYATDDDGATFSNGLATTNAPTDGAYFPTTGKWYMCNGANGTIRITSGSVPTGASSEVPTGMSTVESVHNISDKLLLSGYGFSPESIASDIAVIVSTSDGLTFELETYDDHGGEPDNWGPGAYSNSLATYVAPVGRSTLTNFSVAISNQTSTTTEWSAAEFTPLSDDYRALSHSVLDGYVMLLGTREYQSTNSTWEYYPRRIRWTAPLTYNDFSSSGSGTADLQGSGSLLDSRTVNGRIVTFESSQIGSIAPRGYTTDPWEYDIIKENIRSVSNPVVVDDSCYFIDDSGLLRVTNGMTVESPPFSFDLTEYDDFNADIPVWLTYHPELESLAVFNPAASEQAVYLIETAGGSVSRLELEDVANGGSALSPKSLVCVEHSSDRRLMVGYNPLASDTDTLTVAELSSGETVTGKDEWTSAAADDTYFVTDIQTPEDFIVEEGYKAGIKHIILRTYCDGTAEATNPVVAVQCRSLEDSDWHDNGDSTGTITVDTTTCTGSGTAWSNTLDATNDPVYTTPCLATQARVYDNGILQTLNSDYTITDTKEITFGSSPGGPVTVYWENVPDVKVEAGDLIQTTEGWHRITTVTDATNMSLDHYLSTGSDATATHHPAERMPVGDGEVKIGLTKLTEGVRLRFIIMPDAGGDATVAKITGYSIGYVPCGEKIVEV